MNDIPEERLEELLRQLRVDFRLRLDRRQLYKRGFRRQPELPKLAMEWLQEFANEVGPLAEEVWFAKRRPDDESRYGLPDWVYHEDDLEMPPLDEVHRVRVEGSQTLLLWKSNERSRAGYRMMAVKDDFFKRDMAILAMLVVMESSDEQPKQVWEYKGDEPELEFPRALLRYYRPQFKDFSSSDRTDMAAETYRRLQEVVGALRNLTAYLEYGEPKAGLTRHPLEDVMRDVRAAELKYIDGLKNHQIAGALGFDPPKIARDVHEFKEKQGRKGRDAAKRGKRILEEALGEEGFKEHVEASKAEIRRWQALDDEERLIEHLIERSADMVGEDPTFLRRLFGDRARELLSRLLD
jgi:hypothetical protein